MKNYKSFKKCAEFNTHDLLPCLLGMGKVPIEAFETIWQQILPEYQAIQGSDSCDSSFVREPALADLKKKIREGPILSVYK